MTEVRNRELGAEPVDPKPVDPKPVKQTPTIEMSDGIYTKPVRAIVMFGPATPTMGNHPAQFYQVTIDPNMLSARGSYIRFGNYRGDEIQGWQKVSGITVLEIIGDNNADPIDPTGYKKVEDAAVTMWTVK